MSNRFHNFNDFNDGLNCLIFMTCLVQTLLFWGLDPGPWWHHLSKFILYLSLTYLLKYLALRFGILHAIYTQEINLRQRLRELLAKFKNK